MLTCKHEYIQSEMCYVLKRCVPYSASKLSELNGPQTAEICNWFLTDCMQSGYHVVTALHCCIVQLLFSWFFCTWNQLKCCLIFHLISNATVNCATWNAWRTLKSILAVILCYFTEFGTSQWLKLDPCCLQQKCSPRTLFSEIWFVVIFSERLH